METEVMALEWLDDQDEYPVGELARRSHLLEIEVLELMQCGAISGHPGRALSAARMAARLRQDFELDLQGVALAMTLLRRIEELNLEIARLKIVSS
jgi:chaperone modulatory protein CbpM